MFKSSTLFVLFSYIILIFAQTENPPTAVLDTIGSGGQLGGTAFEFTYPIGASIACDLSCPLFYQEKVGKAVLAFKFQFTTIREIYNNGTSCCVAGEGPCSANVNNCNRHGIRFPNLLNTTILEPGKAVSFTGKIGSGRFTDQCVTTSLNDPVCATVNITYKIYDEADSITIGVNNTMSIRKNSLLAHLKVSGWTYFAGTEALKLTTSLGFVQVGAFKTYLVDGADKPAATNGIQNLTVLDSQNRQGSVRFYDFAYFSGNLVNATVYGSYVPTNANPGAGVFTDIIIQRSTFTGNQDVELYVNLFTVSEDDDEFTGASSFLFLNLLSLLFFLFSF